jgi:hypothetical protein
MCLSPGPCKKWDYKCSNSLTQYRNKFCTPSCTAHMYGHQHSHIFQADKRQDIQNFTKNNWLQLLFCSQSSELHYLRIRCILSGTEHTSGLMRLRIERLDKLTRISRYQFFCNKPRSSLSDFYILCIELKHYRNKVRNQDGSHRKFHHSFNTPRRGSLIRIDL